MCNKREIFSLWQNVETALIQERESLRKGRFMSKAEKFISDCTRNCSNAFTDVNYAKDFKPKGVLEKVYHPWLTPDQARRAVEIAREEMIEKVCSFISDNIYTYIALKHANTPTFIEIDGDRFVNDLKQAMKDET